MTKSRFLLGLMCLGISLIVVYVEKAFQCVNTQLSLYILGACSE